MVSIWIFNEAVPIVDCNYSFTSSSARINMHCKPTEKYMKNIKMYDPDIDGYHSPMPVKEILIFHTNLVCSLAKKKTYGGRESPFAYITEVGEGYFTDGIG